MDLGAGYAITGEVTKAGNLVDLNASMMSIESLAPPLAIASQYQGIEPAMQGLGEFADRARRRIIMAATTPEEEEKSSDKSTIASVLDEVGLKKPPPVKPSPGLETLQTLPTFLRGVDVGDVDGDGSNETVLIDKKTLSIYKQAAGRLRLFRKIEGHRNDSFLTLDVADLNQNGFSEIIVSNIRGRVLRSFVLEFEQRRIKKLNDREKWFYRVIDRPREGLTLVGQKMGLNQHPAGGVYPFVWNGRRFIAEETPLVKKQIPVFSFNIGDVEGRGEPRVVYVDSHEFLHVVDTEGAYLWESAQKYGGSDLFYSSWTVGSDQVENRVYIPNRLLMTDLDGDGVSEVVVSRNKFKLGALQNLKIYDRANLVHLTWSGMGLVENWKTPEIAGYISDYQIRDVDNDGKDELVIAAVSKRALTAKASSAVLIYELF